VLSRETRVWTRFVKKMQLLPREKKDERRAVEVLEGSISQVLTFSRNNYEKPLIRQRLHFWTCVSLYIRSTG